MPDNNRSKRLKRFFVDADPSVLNEKHPHISISENYIVYTQKFGKLLYLHIVLSLISVLLGYCLNNLFYLGLFFVVLGIILNRFFPNQERVYFDKEGLITSNFFHITKKHQYNDIVDIYWEDSPTRYNIYGLLENEKFIIAINLNQENTEHLISVLKAIVTLEGNIKQSEPEKTS